MGPEAKLLPLAKAQGRDYLVDVKNREFKDFDAPDTVIKMHSLAGRQGGMEI